MDEDGFFRLNGHYYCTTDTPWDSLKENRSPESPADCKRQQKCFTLRQSGKSPRAGWMYNYHNKHTPLEGCRILISKFFDKGDHVCSKSKL